MNHEEENSPSTDELDALLSMRGKPFADWREERRYLREKWGEQGKKMLLDDEDKVVESREPPNEEIL